MIGLKMPIADEFCRSMFYSRTLAMLADRGSLAFLDPLDDRSFYLVIALFVLSLVCPVAMTRAITPTPP